MTSLTTPPKVARFDHSSRLSERKRALFPSTSTQSQDNSDDSDIGHMCPLEYSSSPEQPEQPDGSSPDLLELEPMLSDESNDALAIGRFSPDYLHLGLGDQENIDPKTTVCEASPTEILKTPHESTTNVKIPRLLRKSLIDITNTSNLKRKLSESDSESPANKINKFDQMAKTSKARTALFPESIFPAKSFYPKTEEVKLTPTHYIDLTQKRKKSAQKSAPIYLCSRQQATTTKNKNFGLINAGVRHKIKKPRHKPALTKTQLLKAALNIVKNSPLNDYFDDLDKQSVCSENECGVSYEQIQKMDSILKNLDVKNDKSKGNEVKSTQQGIKRCRSPQIDESKKFFKSGHSNKATITITNNIKIQMKEDGELTLIEKKPHQYRRPKREIIEFDPNDFTEPTKMIDNSFSEILKSLEDDEIIQPQSQTISAHNSVIKSENQIQLHPLTNITNQINNTSMLLSPTSLVCDLTSGLALDSPKNPTSTLVNLDKLSTLKKRISFPEQQIMDPTQKLFPIFLGKQNDAKPSTTSAFKENKHVKNIRKIWKPLSENQTLIDAGQRKYGLSQCAECKFVYSLGEPEDENMHYQHHNSISVLRYGCWKHERIVNQFTNGKIIQVNPNDPKPWLKKVKEIVELVNRELGFVDLQFHVHNEKVFLCIMNKQIVGCLVAEPKTHAHKILPSSSNDIDVCSEETYPVKCGVSRLWVGAPHRNKGVATRLVNSMRTNFMFGHVLSVKEIAFSAPTVAGKKFASKYTKTDEFFIYTS